MVELTTSVERKAMNAINTFREKNYDFRGSVSQWTGASDGSLLISVRLRRISKIFGILNTSTDILYGVNPKDIFLKNKGDVWYALNDHDYVEQAKTFLKLLEREFPGVKFKLTIGRHTKNVPEGVKHGYS